jgi:hypothetical protein
MVRPTGYRKVPGWDKGSRLLFALRSRMRSVGARGKRWVACERVCVGRNPFGKCMESTELGAVTPNLPLERTACGVRSPSRYAS